MQKRTTVEQGLRSPGEVLERFAVTLDADRCCGNPIARVAVDALWDDELVAAAIREIAADTESAYSPATLWPMHPLDGLADTPHPRTSVYDLGVALFAQACRDGVLDQVT